MSIKIAALALLLSLLCNCGDNVAPGPDGGKLPGPPDACDPVVERHCQPDGGLVDAGAADASPDGAP